MQLCEIVNYLSWLQLLSPRFLNNANLHAKISWSEILNLELWSSKSQKFATRKNLPQSDGTRT